MTPAELSEELDKRLTPVIERLRSENPGMDNVMFSGTVTGYLLKTGVALAVNGGCPRKILLKSLQGIIEEAYRR